jgi:hypothetical protein
VQGHIAPFYLVLRQIIGICERVQNRYGTAEEVRVLSSSGRDSLCFGDILSYRLNWNPLPQALSERRYLTHVLYAALWCRNLFETTIASKTWKRAVAVSLGSADRLRVLLNWEPILLNPERGVGLLARICSRLG